MCSNIGFAMTNTYEKKIEAILKRAAADTGWRQGEVSVEPVHILEHGGCSFFSVGRNSHLDGPQYSYALLPSGEIVGGKESHPLEKILSICGQDASALWWAGVINHHADTGGILVTEKETPLVAKELKQATGKDVEPVLVKSPDGAALQFYTHEYQRNQSYHVQAKWGKIEGLTLKKTPL